jgi:nitrite reductase (NO-forming)
MKPITGMYLLTTIVLLTLFASGCAAQAFYSGQAQFQSVESAVQATLAALQPVPTSQPEISQDAAGNTALHADQSQDTLGEPDVRIKLVTGLSEGKMAFVGSGGDLEGTGNPDLQVEPGDIVEIILENNDNIQHNLALPDFGVLSADVLKQGETVTIKFKAENEGVYPYYCDIPGHRLAGMEGKLIVGNPPSISGVEAPDISRHPDDLPGPIARTDPENVRIELEAIEVVGRLADGVAYTFWTYNGQVPGPFLRVRSGDTIEVHLKNPDTNTMPHSVDFHAVTGPGGGAVYTATNPGQETSFTFKALNPGVYVYHCATPMIPHHISNGMYGLILVEPEEGLAPVDREFYVMQGEIYTAEPFGSLGHLNFSEQKLLNEAPEYFIINGSVGALTALHPLTANVGETVRIYYGVGGPNFTSAFHVIGEIFDRVFDQASLTAAPLTDVQTTLVPPGGAAVVEFKVDVPGRYILVDHALSRLERGLAGFLVVEGPAAPEIFDGEVTEGSGH